MKKNHSLVRRSFAPRVLATLCALLAFFGMRAQTAVWTPASGGSLAGATQMKIEISDFSSFEAFTGVRFQWAEVLSNGANNSKGLGSAFVGKADVNVAKSGNAATLTFNLPDDVKTRNGVVAFLEGVDRLAAFKISAVYNNSMVTELNPAHLAEVLALGGKEATDQQITAALAEPLASGETLTCYVNSVSGEYLSEIGMTLSGDKYSTNYSAKRHYDLTNDKAYRVELLVFDGDRSLAIKNGQQPKRAATHIIIGKSESFKFSSVTFLGATPENESDINETDNEFTLSFSGLVNLDPATTFINTGSGTSMPFAELRPDAASSETQNGKTYASTWTLVVDQEFLSTFGPDNIMFSIAPRDVNGLLVEGNEGFQNGSYILLTYGCWWNSPELTYSPASGSTVNSLKRIVAHDQSLISISENFGNTDRSLVVKDGNNNEVNTTVTVTPGNVDPSSEQYTFAYIDFDPAITAAGNYTVEVSNSFFMVGEQFEAKPNKGAVLSYTVDPNAVAWEVTPENNLFVSSLKDIVLTFTDGTTVAEAGIAEKITFNSQYAMTPPVNPSVAINGNVVTLSLPEAVVEPSKYVLNVPAGYFTLNGKPSAAIKCAWGVVEAAFKAEISVDPQQGNVRSLKEFVLTYMNIDEVAPSWNYNPVLLNASDKSVVANGQFEMMDDWNKLKVVLDTEVTADGSYILSLPEGSVNYGENGTPSALEEFNYTIGRTYSIVPNPDENQDELSVFEITYATGDSAKVEKNTDSTEQITLTPEGGEAINITAVKIEEGKVTLTLDAPVVAEGKYTLSVPAKKFYVNGSYSDAVEEVYTVESSYVITPANHSFVESLQDFSLTFKKAFNLGVNNYEAKLLLKDAEGTVKAEIAAGDIDIPLPDNWEDPANTANFKLENKIEEYGEYTLEIPEGTFVIDDTQESPAISFTWTIGVPCSITPNPAGTLDELSEILITFEEGATVTASENAEIGNITIGNIYSMNEPANITNVAIEGNVVKLTLDAPAQSTGSYRLFVPEGKFIVNGRNSSKIDVTFDVVIPFVAEYEMTPADGSTVEALKEFTLTFTNVFEVGLDYNCTESIQLLDKDNNVVASASIDNGIDVPVPAEFSDPMNVVNITLDKEIIANGEYKLVIPEAIFTLDSSETNKKLEFTYIVESAAVGVVEAEAELFNVYRIDGINVLSNATADKVKALPAGLYIINGKKVYLVK